MLIPNAIPAGTTVPKRNLVVFGGVVNKRKGFDILQDAWEGIDAPGWELIVAGPVEDAGAVRQGISAIRGAVARRPGRPPVHARDATGCASPAGQRVTVGT
jgi:hypothetical protein